MGRERTASPQEQPFRLPTSVERDRGSPGGRGALRGARGGQRETQLCRSVWAAHLPGRPRCRAPPRSSHALSLNSKHHHRHPPAPSSFASTRQPRPTSSRKPSQKTSSGLGYLGEATCWHLRYCSLPACFGNGFITRLWAP